MTTVSAQHHDVRIGALPNGRQLRSNAHPLVEMTVMRQPSRNRTLIHFVNLSGHSQTGYFAPIEMRDIEVELASSIRKIHAVRLNQDLPVFGRKFILPKLGAYEVVTVE